jgi:hypothetical protein
VHLPDGVVYRPLISRLHCNIHLLDWDVAPYASVIEQVRVYRSDGEPGLVSSLLLNAMVACVLLQVSGRRASRVRVVVVVVAAAAVELAPKPLALYP